MRAPRMRAIGALAIPIAVACASTPRTPKHCDAKEEVIDAYLARVGDRASDALSPTAIGRTEQVTVGFELSPSGIPERISVLSASTPLAAEAARYAVVDAGPYGPPPFSQKACLLAGRVVVSLYNSAKCDPQLADVYVETVSARVQTAIDAKGIQPSSSDGDVVLRVDIARDGAVEAIAIQIDNAVRSGDAIAAAARDLSPFAAPDPLIVECIADAPFFLWYGSTPPTPL